MDLCAKCQEGPSGMRGHDNLQLLEPAKGPRSAERFVLACMECGATWSRIFASEGISWVRATQ